MNGKNLGGIISLVSVLFPFLASAQTLIDIIHTLKQMADLIVPLFMVVAVAVFLWGIIRYITAGGDAEKEKKARGYIIYGLIGIFVLVSFWGLIQIVAHTFGLQTGGVLPRVEVPY